MHMFSISSYSSRMSNLSQFLTIAVLLTNFFLILELLLFFENSNLFIFTRLTWINFCLTILVVLRNSNTLNIDSLTFSVNPEDKIPFLMTQFTNAILNWILIFLNIFGKTFSKKDSLQQWVYVITGFGSTFLHFTGHKAVMSLADEIGGIYESMKIFHYMTYVMNFMVYLLIYQLCDDENLIQLALIYCSLSKCFDVLNLILLTHISRIIFGTLLVLEAITKLQDINDFADLVLTEYLQLVLSFTLSLITSYFILNSILSLYLASRQFFMELRRTLPQQNIQINQQEQSESIGLSVNDLLSLKKINLKIFPSNLDDVQRQSCSICCSDIQDNNPVYYLSCNHLFHAECLDAWLMNKNNCPNCRSIALIKEK